MQLSGAAGVDESDPAFWIDTDPPQRHQSVAESLPLIPSLADHILLASHAIERRTAERGRRGGGNPYCKDTLTPNATPELLLKRITEAGTAGMSQIDLWDWLHAQNPKLSRPSFYYATGRLVALKLVVPTRGDRGVIILRAVGA